MEEQSHDGEAVSDEIPDHLDRAPADDEEPVDDTQGSAGSVPESYVVPIVRHANTVI